VVRALVLSIVFALTAGQNAYVHCWIRCAPNQSSPVGCHDQQSKETPFLAATADCATPVQSGVAFVGENAKRLEGPVSISTSLGSALPPPSASSVFPTEIWARLRTTDRQLLVTVLRL
jgi:hypothetical protein